MKRVFFLTTCLFGVALLHSTLQAAECPMKKWAKPARDWSQVFKGSALSERHSRGCGCGGGGGEGKSNEIPPDSTIKKL